MNYVILMTSLAQLNDTPVSKAEMAAAIKISAAFPVKHLTVEV